MSTEVGESVNEDSAREDQETHVYHRLLVGNLPSSLLRVVVDPDNGVIIGRIRVAATRSLGRVVFGLLLFNRSLLRFEHRVELGQHTGGSGGARRFAAGIPRTLALRRDRTIEWTGDVPCSNSLLLGLLGSFLGGFRVDRSGCRVCRGSSFAALEIRRGSTHDLDFEVRDGLGRLLGLFRFRLGILAFLLGGLAVGRALRTRCGISVLVESFKAFTAESRTGCLGFAGLDLVRKGCTTVRSVSWPHAAARAVRETHL